MLRIYKGSTLEEAINTACDEENIDAQYLNYVVVSQTEDEVIIGCAYIADVIAFVKQYLIDIFDKLGQKIELTSKYENEVIQINIECDKSALFIGRHGQNISSLLKILRSAINTQFLKHYSINLDINGYKQEKYRKFIDEAKRIARDVQKTRISSKLHPMTSDERHVIHEALSNYHHIKTESIGVGPNRSIVIKYDPNKTNPNKN